MDSPDDFLFDCIQKNVWGYPDRWILDNPNNRRQFDKDVIGSEYRPDENGDLQLWIRLASQYTIEITDITYDYELNQCLENRAREYPSPADFMDAFFDGSTDDIKLKRDQVKAKYPKPKKPDDS
jgi:hypothetical protein